MTLEIPQGPRRLDLIFGLIQGCEYSVHGLSKVQLNRAKPRTPSFNMPFENWGWRWPGRKWAVQNMHSL